MEIELIGIAIKPAGIFNAGIMVCKSLEKAIEYYELVKEAEVIVTVVDHSPIFYARLEFPSLNLLILAPLPRGIANPGAYFLSHSIHFLGFGCYFRGDLLFSRLIKLSDQNSPYGMN